MLILAGFYTLTFHSPHIISQTHMAKKKSSFETILTKVTNEELIKFVKAQANKHKDFKTDFEIYFSDKDDLSDLGSKYKKLTKKLHEKFSDRGFIHYRDSQSLALGMEAILNQAGKAIANKNFGEAFYISSAVFSTMMEAIAHGDDSSGYMSGTVMDSISLLSDLSQGNLVPMDLKFKIIDFINLELKDGNRFGIGDFAYELLEVFRTLSLTTGSSTVYLEYLDSFLNQSKFSEYDGYRKEYFLFDKINFLKDLGRDIEAQPLIDSNLNMVSVRKLVLSKLLKEKDYQGAKKLIQEGISIAENKEHPGTVNDWKTELLKIASLENDFPTIRMFTKYFAFDRGLNEKYFRQWKETFKISEWNDEFKTLIDNITKNALQKFKAAQGQQWRPANPQIIQFLGPIYVVEEKWENLLELLKVENSLFNILHYHQYLHKIYPQELLDLYVPTFLRSGEQANSRSEYKDLSKKMVNVIKDIPSGKSQIQEVALQLIKKYPRRPAMIEEMQKVLK